MEISTYHFRNSINPREIREQDIYHPATTNHIHIRNSNFQKALLIIPMVSSPQMKRVLQQISLPNDRTTLKSKMNIILMILDIPNNLDPSKPQELPNTQQMNNKQSTRTKRLQNRYNRRSNEIRGCLRRREGLYSSPTREPFSNYGKEIVPIKIYSASLIGVPQSSKARTRNP
jgi:hypothetical protein